jgi:hypothetical protein
MTQYLREIEIEIIQGKACTGIAVTVFPGFLPHQVPGQVRFYPPWVGI